jgi:hypothetical protein
MNASRVRRESARIFQASDHIFGYTRSNQVRKKILIVACNASGAQQHDALLAVRPGVLTQYPGTGIYPSFTIVTGSRGFAKASRNVITIDWSTGYGRFYEKIRG